MLLSGKLNLNMLSAGLNSNRVKMSALDVMHSWKKSKFDLFEINVIC